MNIDELDANERNVLGGLLRMIVRSDGEFAEDEETSIDALGEGIGGREAIWKIISASAQALPSDEAIYGAVSSVRRDEAKEVILRAVGEVASQGGLVPEEQRVLDRVEKIWAGR